MRGQGVARDGCLWAKGGGGYSDYICNPQIGVNPNKASQYLRHK